MCVDASFIGGRWCSVTVDAISIWGKRWCNVSVDAILIGGGGVA